MKVDEEPEKMPRKSKEFFFFFWVEIRNFVRQNPNLSMSLEIEKGTEREVGSKYAKILVENENKNKDMLYVDSIQSPR